MEYRFLGRTGVRISALVAGTMAYGKEADATTAKAMFGACRDAGINAFDCADVYAGGRAEEILGELIASARREIVLCTKAYFPTGDGPNDRGGSRLHLVRAVEASLRRLATDRIDVLFLHRFDDATDLEETLRGVEMLVAQGKVLYPAVSNFAAWQAARALGIAACNGWAPIVCTQPMYNLAKRQAESEILPMALAEGLGVMTYSPLGGGLLSGKYGVGQRPEEGRLVDNPMYKIRYGDPGLYATAEAFTAIAAREGVHPATLAVAWAGSHPAVTAPIVGGRTVEQLQPCLAAAEFLMTEALREEIGGLSPAPAPATDRNEEGSAHNYGSR